MLLTTLAGVGLAGFAALFVALVVADGALQHAGCGSIDPTDSANYSEVVIQNDTADPVVVDGCRGGFCDPSASAAPLAPGARLKVRGACSATGADMTSYVLRRSDGGLLGFIAIDSPRKSDGLVYDVSRRSPDALTPTPHE